MKNIKKGKIDYSELNVPPEKHEYETARYFANRGYDVKFISPSSIKGSRTPDFEMQGKAWETKSPIKFGRRSFEKNFKKAIKQSENIIFDLRRLSTKDESIYVHNLYKRAESSRVKSLIIITKDGRLLTIKGKFDNM